MNFHVEQSPFYEGRNEVVSSLFLINEKKWNTPLVRNQFLQKNAYVIMELHIPQHAVADKVVWANSNNDIYTAKAAYHFWYESKFGTSAISQCTGWKRVWQLKLPYKIKVFIWCFCRNVVPVHKRLSSKGIRVPITCPMCVIVLSTCHIFFKIVVLMLVVGIMLG